jgi:hypothetical protein
MRAIGFSPADPQEFVVDGWPLADEARGIVFRAQVFGSGHGNMTA